MSATAKEAEIVLHDDVPLVTITREFHAPPEAVYRAHTDPELFARWIGPEYLSTTIDRWDCRTGGEWRYVSSHDFIPFAWYRIAFGLIVLVTAWTGVVSWGA